MNRLLPLMLLALLAIAAPASAANSSLLSGYSGPGGGEQIILGPHGAGGGSGTAGPGVSGSALSAAGHGGGQVSAGGLAQAPSHISTSVAPGIDPRTGRHVRVITRIVSGPAAAAPPAGYQQLAGRGTASSPLDGLSLPLLLLGGGALAASALALRRRPDSR